jgi:O-antigen/teichoic acid export membrane protein
MRIAGAAEVLPTAIATALLPTLARTHVAGGGTGSRMSRKALSLVAAMLVPVAFLLAANSDFIMGVLPVPEEFENSAPLLRILAISIPLTALLTVTGAIAAGADRQKTWAALLVAGLGVNVVFNFLMIPLFDERYGNGATGAAVATLISEFVIIVIAFKVMGRQALSGNAAADLAKVALAAGAMTGVALLGDYAGLHFALWNMMALAVYAGLVLGLRVVTRNDINYIKNTLIGRVRRSRA